MPSKSRTVRRHGCPCASVLSLLKERNVKVSHVLPYSDYSHLLEILIVRCNSPNHIVSSWLPFPGCCRLLMHYIPWIKLFGLEVWEILSLKDPVSLQKETSIKPTLFILDKSISHKPFLCRVQLRCLIDPVLLQEETETKLSLLYWI